MINARLDRVYTFEDQLSFRIPHGWIEEDEDADRYLFHAPNADSGWLRASLITLKHMGGDGRKRLWRLLRERAREEGGNLYESGNNIIVAWEQASEQDGVPVCLYWWAVGHYHGSNLGHEALFSYTILRERREQPETQRAVSLIAKLVAKARFAEPVLHGLP